MHYVRVHLAQLRQKIEADPARPRLLLTEPGIGYQRQGRVKAACCRRQRRTDSGRG